jgi:hypothetical protein
MDFGKLELIHRKNTQMAKLELLNSIFKEYACAFNLMEDLSPIG